MKQTPRLALSSRTVIPNCSFEFQSVIEFPIITRVVGTDDPGICSCAFAILGLSDIYL